MFYTAIPLVNEPLYNSFPRKTLLRIISFGLVATRALVQVYKLTAIPRSFLFIKYRHPSAWGDLST